jgi:hypothetical protein
MFYKSVVDGDKTWFPSTCVVEVDCNGVVLQPRLVVHLKKTPDFDSIFDQFETAFNKEMEDQKRKAKENLKM